MICPICSRTTPPSSPQKPFCSERCKSIDLARWIEGAYRVPGEPVDPDQLPPPREGDR